MRLPLSYATAAEALLALAVSHDSVILNGAKDDPIRSLLHVAAEACHRLDDVQADREAALLYAAELRSLLELAVGHLEAQPLPVEGGTWDSYLLAHQARELLRSAPLTAGQRLRAELHATRVVARAATVLVAAQQEGNQTRIRVCKQALHQAVASLTTASGSTPRRPMQPGDEGHR
jgi:hypothetical protein